MPNLFRKRKYKTVNEIQRYEDYSTDIRAKIKDLDSGTKLTKYHSIRINNLHKKDTVREMQDSDGVPHTDQDFIGEC